MNGYELFVNNVLDKLNDELKKKNKTCKVTCEYDEKSLKKFNDVKIENLNVHEYNKIGDHTVYFVSGKSRYKTSLLYNYMLSELGYKDYALEKVLDPVLSMIYKEDLLRKVTFRLANPETEKQLLAHCPHRKFLDLEVVYTATYCSSSRRNPIENKPVTYKFLSKLDKKVTEEELYHHAMKNSKRSLKPAVEELTEFCKFNRRLLGKNAVPMTYIVANKKNSGGASTLLYQEFLKDFSKDRKKNLLIGIPSSEQAVISEYDNEKSIGFIAKTVNYVNECIENPNPITKNIYLYNPEKDTLQILNKNLFTQKWEIQ